MNSWTRTGLVAATTSLVALSALPVAQANPSASAVVAVSHGHGETTHSAVAERQKRAVLNLLAAYHTGDQSAFAVINAKKFIQHDPRVGDGLSGLKTWLASIPKGQISVKPVRVLVDGSYVMVQSDTKLPTGHTTSWDIFRFEQGKIVEHWNTRQPAAGPNGAGHTELDGPAKVTDESRTKANKSLAWTAMATVFMGGDFSQYGEPIWKADTYAQHSEGIQADGIAGSKPLLKSLVDSGTLVYAKIDKVLGEGNFVLVVGQGSYQGTPYSFYDFFRMSKGQIVEHWDVLEPLTPADQAKNANGQFGFPQDPLSPAGR
ncbi:nuclear transport factor 2 family protein [Streptomyces sp. NPDC090088]|uniref:nuclear transport factor 2 family protein n=1 Tax=Streptomyces sp. NPDC090088 TaxID=3365944 RepID=UPI00380815F9